MTEADDMLALDNQICFALYAANRAVTALYRPLLAELDLTYPQYLVMLVLWEQDGSGHTTRVSSLGQRLRLDSGTLTPLLKRLVAKELVVRQRGTEDERVVTLSLTDAGRALQERARAVPEQLLCSLRVAPERLLALRQELKAVLMAVEGEGEPSD